MTIKPPVRAALVVARLATAKFALDLKRAKRAGYKQITPVMKNVGVH
jgi:hypothetical protein